MQNDWNHKKSTVNGMIFFPHMIFFIFVKRPARGRAGFGAEATFFNSLNIFLSHQNQKIP